MVVIDWLQTWEFVRENAERFILYCVCGCLIGLTIILISIIILLCIEKRWKMNTKRTDTDYADAPAYLPIYRYNGRDPPSYYHV